MRPRDIGGGVAGTRDFTCALCASLESPEVGEEPAERPARGPAAASS